MSQHLTRFVDNHGISQYVPDPAIRPREPSAVPIPASAPLAAPVLASRENFIGSHGAAVGGMLWEHEQRARREWADYVQSMRQRMAVADGEIAAAVEASRPKLARLEAAQDHSYRAYLAACAETENARAQLQISLAPLRGQIEAILRELHGPLNQQSVRQWKEEKLPSFIDGTT